MSLREASSPLSEIVPIPPVAQASSNIEYDSGNMLGRYIPDIVALDTLRRFFGGDVIMSIIGPYGSGQVHVWRAAQLSAVTIEQHGVADI